MGGSSGRRSGSGSGSGWGGHGPGGPGGTGGPPPVDPNTLIPGYSSTPGLNPSWSGGGTVDELDPNDAATRVFGDLMKLYGQGPKVYNKNLAQPYGADTAGLIGEGLANNQMVRGSPAMGVANGDWLSGGNPYFEADLRRAKDSAMTDVNGLFANNGRFGSGAHVDRLTDATYGLETQARSRNFEDEWNRMGGAQGMITGSTGEAMKYAGLQEQKANELRQGEFDLFNRQNDAPYDHVIKTIAGLLGGTGGQSATETANKPFDWWSLLGTLGSVAGAGLSFFGL